MTRAALPPNENERLEALRQTGILDTEPEESFDRLTDLAAKICEAPIALITLVDVDRQWFKSHVGLEVPETPRDVAFCAHAILHPEIMIVRDALEDMRFADNPLVTSDPKIRFYAGNPIVTHDGNALGTFCVIDTVPRELAPSQIEALKTLALHATTMLELRRTKELLKGHAQAWEQAIAKGETEPAAAALTRLGDDLKELIEARERAELSFRALESELKNIDMASQLPDAPLRPDVDQLLGAIIDSSERMLVELEFHSPLRVEAAQIGSFARQARDRITKD